MYDDPVYVSSDLMPDIYIEQLPVAAIRHQHMSARFFLLYTPVQSRYHQTSCRKIPWCRVKTAVDLGQSVNECVGVTAMSC